VLLLALPTGLVLSAAFVLFELSLRPLHRGERVSLLLVDGVATALGAAFLIAAIQLVALAILRLLPWRGPRLDIDQPADLRATFE
jgi:hypothetical protein